MLKLTRDTRHEARGAFDGHAVTADELGGGSLGGQLRWRGGGGEGGVLEGTRAEP